MIHCELPEFFSHEFLTILYILNYIGRNHIDTKFDAFHCSETVKLSIIASKIEKHFSQKWPQR